TQLRGVAADGGFSFAAAFVIFYGVKAAAGLRVGENEERSGLDVGEHGMEAYSGFRLVD
ncbi:MAG: ammonium transporter, partial [Acidobacteria bacterium]|nr:ammonium transporter [Acidobacteriota bacterium]